MESFKNILDNFSLSLHKITWGEIKKPRAISKICTKSSTFLEKCGVNHKTTIHSICIDILLTHPPFECFDHIFYSSSCYFSEPSILLIMLTLFNFILTGILLYFFERNSVTNSKGFPKDLVASFEPLQWADPKGLSKDLVAFFGCNSVG